MNKQLTLRAVAPVFNRQTALVAVMRVVALALASALFGCSINPPKPPRCDGSERRAVNSSNPTVASLLPSKSCSASATSPLGSRDSG